MYFLVIVVVLVHLIKNEKKIRKAHKSYRKGLKVTLKLVAEGCSWIDKSVDIICKKYKLGAYKKVDEVPICKEALKGKVVSFAQYQKLKGKAN